MSAQARPSNWDECWRCPNCGTGFAVGNGKRGGGNCVVALTKPPTCCGREMEQVTNIGIEPPA